jgi:transcriptional regulator
MYVPKLFQEKDWQNIRPIIEKHPFATLVTCASEGPTATHVPLRLVESSPGKWVLQGHLARANPHWRQFEEQKNSLAIFAGPHSYVSPRWYDHVNVPTWNYIAVHIYGRVRIVEDADELQSLMKGLVDQYEGHVAEPARYSLEKLPAEYVQKQMNGIVGFEISVDDVQVSLKLSQNRNEADYANVVAELSKSVDPDARALAEIMSAMRSHSR